MSTFRVGDRVTWVEEGVQVRGTFTGYLPRTYCGKLHGHRCCRVFQDYSWMDVAVFEPELSLENPIVDLSRALEKE